MRSTRRPARFKGQLKGTNHRALKLDGLWGMAFGNGFNNQPVDTLFSPPGPDDEIMAFTARLRPAPGGDHGDDNDD